MSFYTMCHANNLNSTVRGVPRCPSLLAVLTVAPQSLPISQGTEAQSSYFRRTDEPTLWSLRGQLGVFLPGLDDGLVTALGRQMSAESQVGTIGGLYPTS